MQEHLPEHFISKGIAIFYRMSPLHLFVKLTRKILKKKKLSGTDFKDHVLAFIYSLSIFVIIFFLSPLLLLLFSI